MSPSERERLCRALGQEPRYAWHTGMGSDPAWDGAAVLAKRPEDDAPRQAGNLNIFLVEVWPPIDTDPAWTLRAMEAAAGRGLSVEVAIKPDDDRNVWKATTKTEFPLHRAMRAGHKHAFTEAACAVLLAALDAGALG